MNSLSEKKRTTNHVIWRCYIRAELKTQSPLILGSGKDDVADVQCIRDGDGNFFIPGTSLTGRIRNWLEENVNNNQLEFLDQAFGMRADDNGRQSMLMFYDAPLSSDQPGASSIRDSVRLNKDTKTAVEMGKFDYEVIAPEQKFKFRMQALLRENDHNQIADMKNLLASLLSVLSSGIFTLGAKTNRGFGKVALAGDPEQALFDFNGDKTAAARWLEWEKKGRDDSEYRKVSLEETQIQYKGPEYLTLSADFKIPGALLIRSYTADPSAPDVVPLFNKSGKKEVPVVPGTSWAGALSQGMYNLGRTLGEPQSEAMNRLIQGLFGRVDVQEKSQAISRSRRGDKKKTSFASNIIIEESNVNNAQTLDYTRNKIDRFTGGVVESALFTERLAVAGTVHLVCRIRKTFYDRTDGLSPQACAGAVLLALLDFGNGIQPIGGSCSVGRGILKLQKLFINEQMILENKDGSVAPNTAMEPYIKAMAEYLKGGNS